MQNIEVGVVVDNRDITRTGIIKVEHSVFQGNILVKYTSPFMGTRGRGGFVGIPEVGSRILMVQPNGTDEWFYLSTIVDYKQSLNSLSKNSIRSSDISDSGQDIFPDKRLYAFRGIPMAVGMYSMKGHALRLSDSYNSGAIAIKAELKSSLGKTVSLNDSPNADNVVVRNEHGDGLRISSRPNVTQAARSIELESTGPQKYICRESQMDLWVYDGRELNIKNDSTGFNSPATDPERYGNVNVESKNRDINMTVRSQDGRVFIDALGQQGLIQIDSAGIVRIAAQDMEFLAANNISISAGNNIFLKANNIAMEGTASLTMRSSGNIGADGALIFLNSGVAQPVPINIQKDTNHYGD